MEITVREWKRGDLAPIRTAWLEYCRRAARSDMQLQADSGTAMMEWLRSRFDEPGAFGFIAEERGVSAGFLIGRVRNWESVPPIIQARKLGIIDALYVNEAFRRQGIGSRLIESALQVMRDQHVAAIETIYDAGSEASSQIWSRAGFRSWMVHAYRML